MEIINDFSIQNESYNTLIFLATVSTRCSRCCKRQDKFVSLKCDAKTTHEFRRHWCFLHEVVYNAVQLTAAVVYQTNLKIWTA